MTTTTRLDHVTSRNTARAAARTRAEADLYETIRDAGRDAMQSGKDIAAAEREHARNVAAHPGSSSDAWVNAGASRVLGLAPRWEPVFLREYDRATTRAARHFLDVVSPE